MKILGIVAEYNPFHRGHERHLRMAREAVQPDFTFVVLSGCMTQRGEWSLLTPYRRARCALMAGADAVFALPVAWTIRDADHYALGGVSLLAELGATHLAFGVETEEPRILRQCAEILEYPGESFQRILRNRLDEGTGYPRAIAEAMDAEIPGLGNIIRNPNNILGICYLRAMLRIGTKMDPVMIPRTGGYWAERIEPEEPSASAIRKALFRGDYQGAMNALVPESRRAVQEAFLSGCIPRPERTDPILMACLRSLTRGEVGALPDISEGLEDRILRAAKFSHGREELLESVSGKRYSRARISRVLACAMLGITRSQLDQEKLPKTAVLLGLRKKPEMTSIWRERQNLITSSWKNETDLRAWRLWAISTGLPDTLPWTEQVVSV